MRIPKLLTFFLLICPLVLASCLPQATESPGPGASEEPTSPPSGDLTPAPADDWAAIQASGVLRVGTAADYAPFSFFDPDGQMDGFDIALIKDLASRLGVRPEISDFAFDGLLDATSLNQVDVSIAALSITNERLSKVDFTNLYFSGSDGILAPLDSPLGSVTSAADMAGQRVTVQRGSVYEDWVKNELIEPGYIAADQLFSYDKAENAVRDLRESRVDLVMMDRIPAINSMGNDLKLVGQGLIPQQFAMALRKGSTLTAQLNRVLAEAQADGSVNGLIEKYLKVEVSENAPTPPPPAQPTSVPTAVPQACVHGMAYVADLSYDDQNMTDPPVLQPGQPFTKSWRIRNTGTCNWDSRFFLRYVRGSSPAAQMNGQPTPVPAVIVPGATVDMSVNLVAPASPGTYQGFWQMSDPNGTFFGQTIWVGITVPGATPTQPGRPFIQSFIASPVNISSGQCTQLSWVVTGSINRIDLQRNGVLLWGGVPLAGSYNDCLSVAGTYTYVLNATGPGGSTWAQVQVQVGSLPPTQTAVPVILGFQADPMGVVIGQCTTLYWNTANGDSVQLFSNKALIASGLPSSGSTADCPNRTGSLIYTLVVTNAAGQARDDFLIFVDDGSIQPR